MTAPFVPPAAAPSPLLPLLLRGAVSDPGFTAPAWAQGRNTDPGFTLPMGPSIPDAALLQLFRAQQPQPQPQGATVTPRSGKKADVEADKQQSGQGMTPLNKLLAAASTLGILEDWAQTRKFRQEGLPEGNPILGRNPSEGRVNTMVGLGALINLIGVSRLPPEWRNRIWGGVAGAELLAALHNASNSRIGFQLPFGPIGGGGNGGGTIKGKMP